MVDAACIVVLAGLRLDNMKAWAIVARMPQALCAERIDDADLVAARVALHQHFPVRGFIDRETRIAVFVRRTLRRPTPAVSSGLKGLC
jgi:hypothetical protein